MSDLVDEFQEAYKACLAIPTEDSKSSAEQNIAKFIQAARKLEVFFLQKQLLLSDSSEDSEDLRKLRCKVQVRENLLNKYKQKLEGWKEILE